MQKAMSISEHKTNKSVEIYGKIAGYLCAYFLFTLVLFIILKTTKSMPAGWSFLHVLIITFFPAGTGLLLKRYLR